MAPPPVSFKPELQMCAAGPRPHGVLDTLTLLHKARDSPFSGITASQWGPEGLLGGSHPQTISWELLLTCSAAEMKSHCRAGRGPLLGSANKARLVECGSACLHPQRLGVEAERSVETFKGSFVTCGVGYGAGLHETLFKMRGRAAEEKSYHRHGRLMGFQVSFGPRQSEWEVAWHRESHPHRLGEDQSG